MTSASRALLRRCSVLLLAASLPAQTTWIVDRAGGTGVHFTDLPPAVAAARPGDLIQLRGSAQPYSAATVLRALTILGTGGAIVHGVFKVVGLPAGESFAMSGVDVLEPSPALVRCGILLQDCDGAVLLHRVTLGSATLPAFDPLGFACGNCRLVQLSQFTLWPYHRAAVRDSTVVIAQSQLHSGRGGGSMLQCCTLRCRWSRVQISDSGVDGDGWYWVQGPFTIHFDGYPAIELDDSDLVLAGQTQVRGGYVPAYNRCAVAGIVTYSYASPTSFVRQFPGAIVNSIWPNCIKQLPPERPALELHATGQPGALACRVELQGEPQSPVLVAMGPAVSPPLATFAGELFLAIPGAVVLAVGVSDVAGAFTTGFPLPAQLPSGWQFGVQALMPWSGGMLRLANVRVGWIGAD